MECVWDKKSKPRRADFFSNTGYSLALEREFKYDTHIRGGLSTLRGVNGKGEATTVVRIVHSEHPSKGATRCFT